MTSQNNPLKSHRGSALIVTMLLVSVLLVTALILLQRIIPYAKSVRSMHDASQSYYIARGQVDLARLLFLYNIGEGGGVAANTLRIPSVFGLLGITSSINELNTPKGFRGDMFDGRTATDVNTVVTEEDITIGGVVQKIIIIASPFIDIENPNLKTDVKAAYTVSSKTSEGPLKMKLFPTNTSIEAFGTSKTDPTYHTLSSRNAGGLRFDLRGVDTRSSEMTTLKLKYPEGTAGTITLKIQYYDEGPPETDVKTFTVDYTLSGTYVELMNLGVTGNIQEITSSGSVISGTPTALGTFLNTNNCDTANICSLSLILNSPTSQSIDFQLISDQPLPDLNAVVIGDGISGNGLYYQRIIDLIPTPQDI